MSKERWIVHYSSKGTDQTKEFMNKEEAVKFSISIDKDTSIKFRDILHITNDGKHKWEFMFSS